MSKIHSLLIMILALSGSYPPILLNIRYNINIYITDIQLYK